MLGKYRPESKKDFCHKINKNNVRLINKKMTIINKKSNITSKKIQNLKMTECYKNYYEKIVTYSSNIISNRCNMPLSEAKDIGADIASEVFTILCEKHPDFEEKYIYSWLYKTAGNLVKNFIHKFFEEMRHVNISIDDESQIESVKKLSIDPDKFDLKEVSEKFFNSLTPEEINEYQMFFCTDKSLKEISEEINVEYATVRQQKCRLYAKLKKKLLAFLCIL